MLLTYPNFQVNNLVNDDLGAHYKLWLKRETVKICAIMIHPRLVCVYEGLYPLSQASMVKSLKDDCTSLFDTYVDTSSTMVERNVQIKRER